MRLGDMRANNDLEARILENEALAHRDVRLSQRVVMSDPKCKTDE